MGLYWFLAVCVSFSAGDHDVAMSDFVSVLKQTESAIVLFHASYCGHSRQFKPDFSYAGNLLEEATEGKTRAFRVDVGYNASFAEKLGVWGFPAVKFYHGGKVEEGVDYDGISATPIAIKNWALKQLNMLTEIKTREDALELLKRSAFTAVTFFLKPENDFFSSEYKHLSRTTPDMEFAFTCSRETADLLNVPSDGGFVLYHPHDAGFSVYHGQMDDLTAMRDFVKKRRLPLVTRLDHSNPEIVLNDGRTIMLMLLPENVGNSNAEIDEFHNFARLQETQEYLFLISGRAQPVEVRMSEYIGDFTDVNQTQYWILENFRSASDMRKFRCTRLEECLDEFKAGKLERFIKSEPPTLSHMEIVDLQGWNFQGALQASSTEKGLLIFFLAPWCSLCHLFNDSFESAEFLTMAKSYNLTLARIDVAGNDTPGLSVLTYPALRLVLGSDRVVIFEGNYATIDIQTWLAQSLTFAQ